MARFKSSSSAAHPAVRIEVLEFRLFLRGAGGFDLLRLPLSFEPNVGQAPGGFDYVARGQGYGLMLRPGGAVLTLRAPAGNGGEDRADAATVRMTLGGADPAAGPLVLEELASRSNYLLGADESRWLTGVANYARVGYEGVYPGVDVVYYGNQGQLE